MTHAVEPPGIWRRHRKWTRGNSHELVLPAASVAAQLITFVPGANRLPEGGVQTIATLASLLSVAVTVKVAGGPTASAQLTVWDVPTLAQFQQFDHLASPSMFAHSVG